MRGWVGSFRAAPCVRPAARAAGVLEWVAGGGQPPNPVEPEALHRQQAGGEMRLHAGDRTCPQTGRCEGAGHGAADESGRCGCRLFSSCGGGECSDASERGLSYATSTRPFTRARHPLPQGERAAPASVDASRPGLPVPSTRYLKVVSCSTPTGPRACSLPVAMPISAPKPNAQPSANCVDALCSTIAESTSLRNFSAAQRGQR